MCRKISVIGRSLIPCIVLMLVLLQSSALFAQSVTPSILIGSAHHSRNFRQTGLMVHTPNLVTGATSVCVGATITLSSSLTGGFWSSAFTAVATVDSFSGVVTGVTAGTDTISYTVAGVPSTYVITVNTLPANTPISGSTTVCLGSNTTLSDSLTGGTWSTSNNNANVSPLGVVLGLSLGVDTIYYIQTNACGTDSVAYIDTVITTPVAGSISGSLTLCVGATDTYTDSITGGVWGSLTSSLVTIDSAGVATGVAGGVAIIGYTVGNSCGAASTIYTITINPLSNAGLILGTDSVCVGSSITLTDTISGGVWGITNGNALDSAGIITGITAGIDTVTYSTTNMCGTITTTRQIIIVPLPNAGVILGDSGMCVGATITLTDSVAGGAWNSSGLGLIIPYGIATGITNGVDTAIYTVTTYCGTATTTKPITIDLYPVAGVISGPDSFCTGAIVAFTDFAVGGVWSSLYPGRAYISDTGLVSALSYGTDTIYYTVTNSCSTAIARKGFNILSLPIAGSIGGPDSVCLNGSITLIASAYGGSWSLSNNVDSISGGIITGMMPGTDTVAYVVSNYCGSDTTTYTVATKLLPVTTAITGVGSMCIAASTTLIDTTASGVWTTTNNIASVAGSIVTGILPGVDTIVYSVYNSCGVAVATKTVTVDPMPNAGIISGRDTVCIGSTVTLTESVTGGTWSSAFDSTASIISGHVTGHHLGTDSIYYTLSNSCGTVYASFGIRVMTTLSPSITGSNFVCVGSTGDTLLAAPLGGVWSASNTHAAVVHIAPGGLVTGLTVGTDSILYTTTNVCGITKATFPITVNQVVHPDVTGISVYCKGNIDTLNCIPLGGYWTATNANATVHTIPTGGVVTADSEGIDTIVYIYTNECGTGSYSLPIIIHSKAYCDSANSVGQVISSDARINIYPNPNSGSFSIVLPEQGKGTITLLDVLGRTVNTIPFDSISEKTDFAIPGLQQGTYVVRIVVNAQIYIAKMVIVQ